ncbi:hypothetical protein, partial [Stutzerimonas kunmingensis]|uniref:hypothetical protein n=1 Tax=Stutzerimonas kunmingensis TaxID=1211807 RepID=UPI001CD155C9
QAEPLGTADLNGGAFFNAEFGIRHRGSTVPERSGVALSFCRRPCYLRRRKPQITCYLLFKINTTISPTNVKM